MLLTTFGIHMRGLCAIKSLQCELTLYARNFRLRVIPKAESEGLVTAQGERSVHTPQRRLWLFANSLSAKVRTISSVVYLSP